MAAETDPGQKLRILALIPARGGSKGLPGKNIRLLSGNPLIAYSIAFARSLGSSFECVVSTDDEDIAEIARRYGAPVPFMRPDELATDSAPSSLVISHAINHLESLGHGPYDLVLLLEPTSPVRDPDDISRAVEMITASPHLDGVVSVSTPHFHPDYVGVKKTGEDDMIERWSQAGHGKSRRQEFSQFFRINGVFYLWKATSARRLTGSWFDEGVYAGLEIDDDFAFNVDTESDFKLMENAIESRIAHLPSVLH